MLRLVCLISWMEVYREKKVQRNFLHKLEISETRAFLDFNFAPTVVRRTIGILGLLHKRVLGLCHPTFDKLLPWYSDHFDTPRAVGHNKPLYGHWLIADHHPALYGRSIFGMIDIYNNLPQSVVDATDVSSFQSLLTDIVKERCRQQVPRRKLSFCRRPGPDLDGPIIS